MGSQKFWVRIWIVLAGIAILSAAFLGLNFRAAASNTQAEKNFITTSMGDRLPEAMQRRDKISILVAGEGRLVNALQKAMAEEMRQAGLGDAEVVQELEPASKKPVLIVNLDQPAGIWTPFYATSRFSIQAGYASNGDATFMSGSPSVVSNQDGPVLHMSAQLNVNDRSWGILSRPGYDQVLVDWLVQTIVGALKTLYEGGKI